MYGKLQSHTNLVASRKAAIDLINSTRNTRVFSGAARVSKGRAITMIKKGYFDSFEYGISPDPDGNVILLTRNPYPLMVVMGKIH